MIESFVEAAQTMPVWGILLATFLIAYIENLFPPSPSDILLVFVGTLVGIGTVGFAPVLLTATAGSVVGFATAYAIGRKYGRDLIKKGWVPFISTALLEKVETWFEKYHGLIIVGNRFLAGTRAVISFAAGIAKLPFPRTTLYCTMSALAWNAILIVIGLQLGSRWKEIGGFLSAYGWIVTGVVCAGIVLWFIRKRKRRSREDSAV